MIAKGTFTGPIIDQVANDLGEMARRQVPLGPFCTYKVGGAAELFVEVDSIEQLESIAEVLADLDVDQQGSVLVIGKGSNLLVADHGFSGLVIHLGEGFASVAIDGDRCRVVAGGAALLPVVARRTAVAGLSGFEWAVGVPGSMGGAAVMNAGGHGSDMAASLVSVDVFDLFGDRYSRTAEVAATDLELGYRHSSLGPAQVVCEVVLQLEAGDPERSKELIGEIVQWRRANQPGGQNAGSVFANPPGNSAGKLIDSLGLKGLRIGTAEVSPKHANFIQADPQGSADDVYALILEVQRRVNDATGIMLRPENRLIGFDRCGVEASDGARDVS